MNKLFKYGKKNASRLKRSIRHAINLAVCATATPYSKLFFVGNNTEWVLTWEIKEINSIAQKLDITTKQAEFFGLFRQSVFFPDKYILRFPDKYLDTTCRVVFPYFHGYPTSQDPIHKVCFSSLKKNHNKISRIQVSHRRMYDYLCESGIEAEKLHIIPIGINPTFFKQQTCTLKNKARIKYGVPQEAVVIGSFQKDGNGWGEGLTPKMIKGPDIFLKSMEIVRQKISELYILLSGPARGYVKQGLEKLNIPYKHIYLRHYPNIGELFHCLDAYVVASREEGGPKAILESMASGVPLVTTRVGQAMDIVTHGKNAFMTAVEDAEALAACALQLLADSGKRNYLVEEGLKTAEQNTYASQLPLWKDFFKGFVHTET